jgi:hypothetical protein
MLSLAHGGILALDLSRSTGWCYGAVDDERPAFGVWHLPKIGGEGGRYGAFENVLIEAMEEWRPGQLILEAPLSLQAMLGISTAKVMQQQYTLRGLAFKEAWRASAPIQEIDSQSVRCDVMGRRHFPKETVKAEVVRYCRGRGWMVPDHNAADACLTWVWLVDRLRHRRPASGPLFATIGSGR